MKFLFSFLSIIIVFSNTKSAKVLLVEPMAAHSHFTIVFRIAKELADRGHEVTVINPYPQQNAIRNYKDISVKEINKYVDEIKKKLLSLNNINVFKMMTFTNNVALDVTKLTLQHQNVQNLLNSNETFDAVILEHFFDEALAGLAYHFKAPLILLSTVSTSMMNNYLFDNPAPSSYVPNICSSFTKHMNFWERLSNFFQNMVRDLIRELYSLPQHRKLFKKYIKSDIELDDILYKTSLMLTNSHVSVTDAIPHVPSIIEIGGFHVNSSKHLPKKLKEFLDNAKDGVVLFSMGSNLKSEDLKPDVRGFILRAFSKIKQQVLWKFESELPDCPENVKIMKWIPQQGVLAHPNVKAFIFHGGLLSTIETVYHGVPVVGVPVFADQKHNIASAVNNGYASSMPLDEINEERFTWALTEILNNPHYRENVQKRSKLMHDQPINPIDAAIFWIEQVIRHKGASYLRSPGLDLRWYQHKMVDVYVSMSVVGILACFVIHIIAKKALTILCKR